MERREECNKKKSVLEQLSYGDRDLNVFTYSYNTLIPLWLYLLPPDSVCVFIHSPHSKTGHLAQILQENKVILRLAY